MSHGCRAEGCSTVVADDRLMCAHHWRLVPQNVQRAVYASWRAVRSTRGPKRLEVGRNYVAAVCAAVESVRKAGPLA